MKMMNLIYSIEGFSGRHSALFSIRGLRHQAPAAAELSHTQILRRATRCNYNMPIFKGFYSYLICISKHFPEYQQTSMDKDILYMHMHIKDTELCTHILKQA